MGMNYYFNRPNNTSIHIGKSSMGWQFLFNTGRPDELDPFNLIDSFDAWMNFLDLEIRAGGTIVDEHDRPQNLVDFRKFIIKKQIEGRNAWSATDEMVGPWAARVRAEKGSVTERYCAKGFRFSTAREFS